METKNKISDGVGGRKMTATFRRVQFCQEKQLTPAELKKFNNFIQYREFLLTVNMSNGIVINPELNSNQYKAFICKGNNGILLKSIIKSRPWWCIRSISDVENCTLVWTEWKKSKLTESLPNAKKNDYEFT